METALTIWYIRALASSQNRRKACSFNGFYKDEKADFTIWRSVRIVVGFASVAGNAESTVSGYVEELYANIWLFAFSRTL